MLFTEPVFFSSHDVDQGPRANLVPILLVVLLIVLLLVNEHDVHVTHPPLLLVVIAGAGGSLSLLLGLDVPLLVEMLHLIALVLIMRVDGAAQHTDEVSKKPVYRKMFK